jgi:hypothetical protein
VAINKEYLVNDISTRCKEIGKGVKINDFFGIILSMTLKEYFKLMGDEKTQKLNIVMPFNLRNPI